MKPGTAKTGAKLETSKAEAKPEASKAGVKPKVPITAPEPDTGKDASKESKKPAPKRDIKQTSSDSKRKEPMGNRSRAQTNSDHPYNRQGMEVCRLFLRNQCRRGDLCKYFHPRSVNRQNESRRRSRSPGPGHISGGGGGASGPVVCRDFLRNMCHRGANCRFFHPPLEVQGGQQQQVSWFIICQDFLSGVCMRPNCRLVVTSLILGLIFTTNTLPLSICAVLFHNYVVSISSGVQYSICLLYSTPILMFPSPPPKKNLLYVWLGSMGVVR